ncbi:hypothetical protein ASF79_03145 [Agreia sp. Leaf335]|uniref:hypothetical protein n=1 Tax=Agreia sp. Leaf335 TaxID=1736340 RepID=UPI0006FA5042|nr:hypothetical protein [Agreia sp. Leaf335]KQR24220.1 hypothetical protein ASF79_03145 [Agreia sp. Leaf335]
MMSSAPPHDLLRHDEQTTFVVHRGPWTIGLRAGELDDIRHGGLLVLRSIRAVVRDENWRTVPSIVERVHGADLDAGVLVIEARTHDERIRLSWRLEVSFVGDELSIAYRAEAQSDLLRNRLGLIVLHSPELAGTGLEVRHASGGVTSTVFPDEISPHQPAVDVRGLDWVVAADGGSTRCALDFSGDVFEMEDQRNWTDASYKTYSTPLSLPFPVAVRSGEVVEQAVVLRCASRGSVTATHDERNASELVIGDIVREVTVPALTTTASTAASAESDEDRVQATWARILLVELDPSWSGWPAALARAIADAAGRPLDVRLVADSVDEAGPILDALADHPAPEIARIALFNRREHCADPETARSLLTALDERGLDIQVIAGTRAHFTELNRSIDRLDAWRGPLTFSITPFMHDTSGHQLVESIAMQREVADNARRLAGHRPLHIGPITLGARFNAVATTPISVPTGHDLRRGYAAARVPGATDERGGAASLAAWLLASFSALVGPRVLSVSYLEEWGPRSPAHESAIQVLSWLSELEGQPVRSVHAPGLTAFAAGRGGVSSAAVLVGNLSPRSCDFRLPGSAVPIVIGPGEVRRFTGLTGGHGYAAEPG